MNETYLTLKQAAEYCGMTYATLRREIENNRLAACRVGRKYFLAASVVEKYRASIAERQHTEGYTIKEVMEILPLSYAFIIDLIKKKKLPAVKCGRRYIIPYSALQRFIADAEQK